MSTRIFVFQCFIWVKLKTEVITKGGTAICCFSDALLNAAGRRRRCAQVLGIIQLWLYLIRGKKEKTNSYAPKGGVHADAEMWPGLRRRSRCCEPIRITRYKRNYVTSINMDTSHGARVWEKKKLLPLIRRDNTENCMTSPTPATRTAY